MRAESLSLLTIMRHQFHEVCLDWFGKKTKREGETNHQQVTVSKQIRSAKLQN